MILEAYGAGQRRFGESRVQEFLLKQAALPSDILWHFIGHLQTNKVRQIIGKTALIESVDSDRLISLIDEESMKAGIVSELLLQVHVAAEETKFGFLPEELIDFFENGRHKQLKAVKIRGLMGMATNTDDEKKIRDDFREIHSLYLKIKELYPLPDFNRLSMGMSSDWPIAVEEGADIIRVGSAIFGNRDYSAKH